MTRRQEAGRDLFAPARDDRASGSRPARGDARPRRTRRLRLLELTPDQTARQGYKQVSLKHPLARSDKS